MSLILFFALGTFFLLSPSDSLASEAGTIPSEGLVVKVYDGDTVTLDSGDRVRLRWVNTPELKPMEAYGIEARDAARSMVDGKTVSLDVPKANPRDGYGRLIAAISTPAGDLATHLVEMGLAHVFIIPPEESDLTALLNAQKQAKAARRGIWSDPSFKGELHITSFHANAPGDDRENVNGEYLRVCNVSNSPIQLLGYTLKEQSGQVWALPKLLVPPGHTFLIHSGKGKHVSDPKEQLRVFLGSEHPIWNNKGDEAFLLDPQKTIIAHRIHAVKKPTK